MYGPLSFVAIMATALNGRYGSKNETARAVERCAQGSV